MDSQGVTGSLASRGPRRVLVVDQEPHVAELIATALRLAAFDTRVAHSGPAALTLVPEFRPQLILLDTVLADLDQRIRQYDGQIRIVFLADQPDGFDDCIVKPFSLDDVVARCRALLGDELAANNRSALRFADLELDPDRRVVRRADNIIELSPTEFAVLRLLLENSGRVLSRPQILAHVWAYDFRGDASIVESYISFLRKKIDCFDPPLIQTLRGIGYSLRLRSAATPEGT
jgi:two-component system OmpR family response regulator